MQVFFSGRLAFLEGVSKPNVICSFRGGGRVHYYQYTQPNRKSASSKHTLSRTQKTDSGLLMHYRPYVQLIGAYN